MAINQIPSLRTWVDGQAFSARDYVYERNVIIDKVNELVLEVNELSTSFDVDAPLGDNILDDRYFTETELLTNGVLDARYYREGEVDGLLNTERNRLNRLESKFDATILAENDQLFDQAVNTDSAVEFASVKLGANVVNEAFIDGLENKYTTAQVDAALALKINATEKGAANGVATLDGDGRLPVGQLPLNTVVFRGTFGDGVGDLPTENVETGDFYICVSNGYESTVAGVTFDTGDKAVYDGSAWSKIDNTETVTGVKGDNEVDYRIGNVNITKANIGLGNVTNDAQVTSVAGTSPIVSSGGTTPTISITAATQSAAGSMSSADKTKLDGIATNANNYVHPDHTGDVISVADGATSIVSGVVTLAKMADLTAGTIIGNDELTDGVPKALTASEARTLIDVYDKTAVDDALALKVNTSAVGTTIATLEGGKVPTSQLPSYVDGLDEFADFASFPATGIANRIYVALDTGKSYRWGGSAYAEISPSEVNSVNNKTGIVVLSDADIAVDASGFSGVLDTDDTDVEKALTTLDAHTHAYSDITDKPSLYTQAQVDTLLAEKADVANLSATITLYDNTVSELTATNLQDAVDELDALIAQNTSVIKIQRFVITDNNGGADGNFTYTYNGNSRTGTVASGQYRFDLEDDVVYIVGQNRLEIKVNNNNSFYSPDTEIEEIDTNTVGITYALANNDEVFIKVYQGLDSVALVVPDGSITTAKLSAGLQSDLSDYETHIGLTNNPHSVTKTQVGLSAVTNDAQVKKLASSTDGNIPAWNGTTGDTLSDGYGVQTTLSSSTTHLVRADAIQAAVNTLDAAIDTKQATLVSGSNIKTINGSSILGAGNYEIDIPAVSVQETAPNISTANVGDLWWNTSNAVLYIAYDDGSSKQWVEVSYADIQAEINALINGAPGALDTLNELAEALGDDPNFATTVTNALAGKASTTDLNNLTATVNTKLNQLASLVAVSANRTLELNDKDKTLYCTNTDPITISIPTNATIAFPVGSRLEVLRKSTGKVTFAPISGVTLYGPTLELAYIGKKAELVKVADNEWFVNVPAETKEYTGTILTTDWSGTDPVTATVTVAGMNADDTPIADLVLSATYADWADEEASWSLIKKAVTGTNQIVFSATETPTVDLNFKVKAVR